MTQTIQNQQLGFNVASVIRKLLATLAIVSPEWSTDRKFSSGTASGVPKCGRVFFLLVSNMSFFGWVDFFFGLVVVVFVVAQYSFPTSIQREGVATSKNVDGNNTHSGVLTHFFSSNVVIG